MNTTKSTNNFKEKIKEIIGFPINLIAKAWKGEERLWVVFWVYFFLVDFLNYLNFVFKVFPKLSYDSFFSSNSLFELYAKFAITSLLITFFRFLQIIFIWRCAFNCNWKVWGYISRTLIVMIAFLVIYGVVKDFSYLINAITKINHQ
jgi:hypothetical protein